MEEKLKNDLAGIAYSHPFFSGIVENALNYIKELETEVESQHKTIDKLVEEQEEREKYTHSLEEENNRKNIEPVIINNKMYFIDNELYKDLLKDIKTDYIPISVIQNKITPVIDELEKDGFVGYADELRDILDEILEKGNK